MALAHAFAFVHGDDTWIGVTVGNEKAFGQVSENSVLASVGTTTNGILTATSPRRNKQSLDNVAADLVLVLAHSSSISSHPIQQQTRPNTVQLLL